MRLHPIPLITILIFSLNLAFAQELRLKTGSFVPEANITQDNISDLNRSLHRTHGRALAILQFEQLPTTAQRVELKSAGIELLEYIPDNSFSVSISGALNLGLLQRTRARSIQQLSPRQKMHPNLAKGLYPSWATRTPGMVDVWVSFPRVFSFEEIRQLLLERGVEIASTHYKDYHVLGLKISHQRIEELAGLPFIEYVEPAPHGDQALNNEARNNSRGNILNAPLAPGGYNLNGEGVVVGVGDNADVQYHVDFTGRLINFAPAGYFYHGVHVHGTVGGGGLKYEDFKGYAPKSTIVSQNFSGIISNATAYANDFGMVLTNNSYGDVVNDCSYAGTYDLLSRVVDLQAASLPNLQHVFASGNDGALTCAPYPAFFRTVLGAYQSAKNIVAVGATDRTGSITSFSSRGPVKDGRIKPEITADGYFTTSTIPDDNYGVSQGTSMAAPGVAGGLTLLYQRYRQLNGGSNPKSGLMKALLCNGGTDQGNGGPDYTYGFGWMNLLRSVDMLNNTRYFISSVSTGGAPTHSITVPANTAQLKVMLYWHDPAASVYAAHTLVNDLDLEVTTPSSSTILPWKLDTLPANVNNAATNTAADHINNIEQVTLDNPASGNYTVTVRGTLVPSSPQEYFMVYDFIPVETRIVHPIGAEAMNPGETTTIQWESYGNPTNTFTVEYSTDNGANWTVINNSVAANLRQLSWTVPNVPTDQALVRVTRNGTAMVSTSSAFTILGIPVAALSAVQCEGYIALEWPAIAGATDYELFILQGSEMVSVATTAATNYTFTGLANNIPYWVSVRARLNGNPGRRASALTRTPNTGSCAGSISDNDLRMEAITAPVYGRLSTSTALTATTQIVARFKNLDDANVNSFDMRYYVNGVLQATEPVTATVLPGATYTHTFTSTYNFSAVGDYLLTVEVLNTTGVDPIATNNSRTDTIRQIANDLLVLPFADNIEAAVPRWYYTNRYGVEGIRRYDYTNTDPLGRLSTFLSSGMANSGTKSLILDYNGWNGGVGNTNFVTGTYNLNGLNAATQDIRLDFQFKSHGDVPVHADNRVWVRGNDSQPWVQVLDLTATGNEPGIFKKSPSIEMSDLLTAAGQNYSSSFQVRWGQYGIVRINDNEGFQGHNFDDIRIYEAIDDMQLISIDTPIVNSCGLSSTVPVRITIRNASPNTLNNIPVRLIVDGVIVANETIVVNPSGLAPNTSHVYTFTATANLSTIGNHTVEVILLYPTDNFSENDALTVNVVNTPVVNSFPYLENFEGSSGNWYSGGKNSSWEYGTPASPKIARAANGTKAWKTTLAGIYNNRELSYLYSPCFDVSGMTAPTLSMSIALDLEDCGGSLCDGAYVEYSTDGITWNRLGAVGTGTNWYNKNYSGDHLWSVENYTRWHVATCPLPTGETRLRFRVVVSSDPFTTREGIAIDDVHIYDNTMGIYDGATMATPVTQNIPGGTSWIHFTSGGKLVASIQPNNQAMGSTDVQAYINTAGVRNDSKQYYHDRNITIKPANTALADSAIVRFYFLDTETEALINASGCATCTKPAMAYELGVSKYSDPDDNFENGTLADNANGAYLFISADWNPKIPFDKGYYVEFRVKDFSEFWLNDGGISGLTSLPVQLTSFRVKKINKEDVLAEWSTASEQNANRFELEVAKGNDDYLNRRFVKIGEVPATGNSSSPVNYSFTDLEPNKTGVRYYRLRIVDNDGTYVYSPVRPIVFKDEIQWQVYPNPSTGLFQFIWQLNDGETVLIKVYDGSGRQVKQVTATGNGFVQKTIIDLKPERFASGVYLLQVHASGKTQAFKLIKRS